MRFLKYAGGTSRIPIPRARFKEELVVYPNPVVGERFSVAIHLAETAEEAHLDAYDLGMQRVYHGMWRNLVPPEGVLDVDGVTRWAPGPYLMRVRVKFASGEEKTFPITKLLVER